MTTHAIVIDSCGNLDTEDNLDIDRVYWWVCTCGGRGPDKHSARSARTGGQRHVAAMERGRDPFAVLRQPGKGGARTTEGRERAVAKFERRAAIARRVMRGGK